MPNRIIAFVMSIALLPIWLVFVVIFLLLQVVFVVFPKTPINLKLWEKFSSPLLVILAYSGLWWFVAFGSRAQILETGISVSHPFKTKPLLLDWHDIKRIRFIGVGFSSYHIADLATGKAIKIHELNYEDLEKACEENNIELS